MPAGAAQAGAQKRRARVRIGRGDEPLFGEGHHLFERGARPEADLSRRAAGCVRRGADDYRRKRRGKSECALELIKHGHQLVADDVVDISRVGRALFGESPEMVRDFMELRGVGIVDIKAIFGIGSIVRRSRIDLVIHLEFWQEGKDYDRLGNKEKTMEILGVELPLIELPVRPGRSLAMVVEIAARNWRLKAEGYDAVAELDRRLKKHYTHQE